MDREKMIARAHDLLERDWRIVQKYELYAEEMANFAIQVSKEQSNDKAVIDDFLARVDERMQSVLFQGKNQPLANAYLEAKRQVYAEMFCKGGE